MIDYITLLVTNKNIRPFKIFDIRMLAFTNTEIDHNITLKKNAMCRLGS